MSFITDRAPNIDTHTPTIDWRLIRTVWRTNITFFLSCLLKIQRKHLSLMFNVNDECLNGRAMKKKSISHFGWNGKNKENPFEQILFRRSKKKSFFSFTFLQSCSLFVWHWDKKCISFVTILHAFQSFRPNALPLSCVDDVKIHVLCLWKNMKAENWKLGTGNLIPLQAPTRLYQCTTCVTKRQLKSIIRYQIFTH